MDSSNADARATSTDAGVSTLPSVYTSGMSPVESTTHTAATSPPQSNAMVDWEFLRSIDGILKTVQIVRCFSHRHLILFSSPFSDLCMARVDSVAVIVLNSGPGFESHPLRSPLTDVPLSSSSRTLKDVSAEISWEVKRHTFRLTAWPR